MPGRETLLQTGMGENKLGSSIELDNPCVGVSGENGDLGNRYISDQEHERRVPNRFSIYLKAYSKIPLVVVHA